MKTTCLYIAGKYSDNNVITILDNMRRGMRMATRALLAGFSPFCPWCDHHFQLMLRDGETLTVEDYYRYSMAWLRRADAVYVLKGWESSKGTKAEIYVAMSLGIPVYYESDISVEALAELMEIA